MTNDLLRHKQNSGKKVADINLRKIEIKTLVNSEEHEVISRNAAQVGMARGAYLRALGLEHEIVTPQPVVEIETLVALGRIGNNLNQVAKSLNAGQIADLKEVLSLIAELKALLLHG